jgi:hypothetical protein
MYNLTRICPVSAELFRAEGRRDTTKLIVDFLSLTNAPIKLVMRSWTESKGLKQGDVAKSLESEKRNFGFRKQLGKILVLSD